MPDWVFLASEWIIRLVMIPLVAHSRRRPLEAIAWLAVIFLLPWIGAILYLWLAEFSLRQGRKRNDEAQRQIARVAPARLRNPNDPRDSLAREHLAVARSTERLLTERLGGIPLLGGNTLELLEEGQVIDRMIEDIDGAREHVHLLFFIFNDDETGWRVAHALARARERGVRCRVLADAWASRSMFRNLQPWMKQRGIDVHGLLRLSLLRRPLVRMDVRNHRKIAIIDGRIAYTGSANLHDPDWNLGNGIWHQIAVRVRGPVVDQLQLVFLEDWYMATERLLDEPSLFADPHTPGEVVIQPVPTGPAYSEHALQHLVVEVLHQARERIVITTPYFVPDVPSWLALRLAALAGVEVDVILPRQSDRTVADAAGRGYFQELLDAGVRIHQHTSGVVHAKTISVDDSLALIGTANFDRRSFFLNYEVTLVVYDAGVAAELRRRQMDYLPASRAVTADAWRQRPRSLQVLDDTAKLLSPLL